MSNRKSISKKLRFEVFKRDKFTCQYCGDKAPDVVLHVDHIDPVANGGGNDILNLITSCQPCNSGKGARLLEDNAVLDVQRDQLEALAERREQIGMMMNWRKELQSFDDEKAQAINEVIFELTEFYLTEDAIGDLKKVLRKYSFDVVLEAVDSSFETYYKKDDATFTKAFNSIGRIAAIIDRGGMSEVEKRKYYIRGILRNRNSLNDREYFDLFDEAVERNVSLDDMEELAKRTNSWFRFYNAVCHFIQDRDRAEEEE